MSGNEVTTIKPCPHCGGSDFKGPHFVDYVGDHHCPSWWIQCENCPCSMEVHGEEVTELLKAWNRRAGEMETVKLQEKCPHCDGTGKRIIYFREGGPRFEASCVKCEGKGAV